MIFMKIGLVSFHTFSQPGGVQRHIFGLFKEFRKRGIETKIIVPRRNRRENYGSDVILMGTSFPLNFSGSQADFNINFNPFDIDKILKKEKFDILHFHNFGFPSVFQLLISPYASNTLNILTFHANVKGSEFLKRFPFFLNVAEKIIQWKIHGIIGVAQLDLEPFKRYKGPKIVIPNGIDLRQFNPQCQVKEGSSVIEKFSDGKINILFLGRIEERKGLTYLLQAYQILEKKFSNIRLLIVGEGPLKSDLENWVRSNKLKNVFFEGEASENKIHSYYASSDIFCSPAIFGESFGMVLLEAMACGKPVVAFSNDGYKDFLKDKKAGFLVPPKNYKALAEKLEILVKNPILRKKMGKWGIEEAKEYSWTNICDKILNFYQLCRRIKGKKKT